jgi:hypothetical protein
MRFFQRILDFGQLAGEFVQPFDKPEFQSVMRHGCGLPTAAPIVKYSAAPCLDTGQAHLNP